ncbi:MAG: methionyl-tRNA formyltransferase [Erysipelotrichaceae bacterium]|nr:methionyl-tRNA formyltransferase [Erysipelotrichaceae bacterium]
MGTPEFAQTVLQKLLENDFPVVGVVTQPDAYVGRKKILTYSPVKKLALEHNIPVLQPVKIRLDYQAVLDLRPTLIITCAYGQIIPQILLDAPKYGCINTHGSLLPKYRGGAPIQRAIINGETETGITLMYMDAKMDEGDILVQKTLPIAKDDTSTSLFRKLSYLAADMLVENLEAILKGEIRPVKQDHSQATYAYNLKKIDEMIDFSRPAEEIANQIRGLSEEPGAYGVIAGEKLKLFVPDHIDEATAEPGTVVGMKDGMLCIACGKGSLLVREVQPEGKKRMPAKDFYNGKGKSLTGKQFEKITEESI